jgi:hypothetical protein
MSRIGIPTLKGFEPQTGLPMKHCLKFSVKVKAKAKVNLTFEHAMKV